LKTSAAHEHQRISRLNILCFLLLLAFLINSCSQTPQDYFQGYIEGEYVLVASPIGGRLDSLTVSRGQNVARGEPLFVLEHAREEALVSEAERGVAKAENILADLNKGKRPSEISAVEARLEQTRASSALSRDEFERRQLLFRTDSIPQEELDRARTEMERNASLVAEVNAELATAQLGARPDLQDAARSDLDAARSRLQQARWQLDQKSQAAPAAGFVFDTFFSEGEFVPAAYPVVSLLPPVNVKIRFFVPEEVLAGLAIGAKVSVSLDGRKDSLQADITYISPQAEYTPPVIYSRDTRAKLVFMIEAAPDSNTAAGLHPGQPVDVRLEQPNG
jgi:HlyD family secretion protein